MVDRDRGGCTMRSKTDIDHRGREPHRRLVQHQQIGRRGQSAGDRQHLLLAARQGAGELVAALSENRKQLDRWWAASPPGAGRSSRVRAHLQIFHDRHRREYLAAFRHVGDAELCALGAGRASRLRPVTDDLAEQGADHAGDGLEQRGLAGAVWPHDGDELPLFDDRAKRRSKPGGLHRRR